MPDRRFLSVWLAAVCLMVVSGCDHFDPVPVESPPVSSAPKVETTPGAVDDDAPEEFSETASGLKYRVRRDTDGPKPAETDTVTVHYRGWLDDGTEFDSSYKRGDPTSFRLDQVVAGWTEGLQLVGEGGMIELEIPSELGYGASGQGPIPPNATLHFLVELLEIQ